MFAEHSKHQLKIRTQMMLLELRYEPVQRFEASQKTRDQVGIIDLFFTDVSQSPAQAPGPPPCTRPCRIGSNPFSESSMRLYKFKKNDCAIVGDHKAMKCLRH